MTDVLSHPAGQELAERFKEDAERDGLLETYMHWKTPIACGCMGPQGGAPLCPCAMNHAVADALCKAVVELKNLDKVEY